MGADLVALAGRDPVCRDDRRQRRDGRAADPGRESPPRCRDAGATSFVDGLSGGIDTVVGEGGRRLSAGQARRIALARAIARDAPLLILDEPTAHLDPTAAAEIAGRLARAARGRTVLLITHDRALATIADRVYRLHGGRTTELPVSAPEAIAA